MQNHIRNTNLRFNLDKDPQRKAWEYLQTMDRQNFKSYSQVISIALVDYFDRYYRTQADPYLETREREELFVKQIVEAVEHCLKQSLPLFLSGLTAGMAQREPQIRPSFPTPENTQPDCDVDWDFLGE
ncbi:MAG: adenylate cyclase [Faecalimonas umbilicata]|uniref:adenylate cyclase n=1 Tax=Faecalimonas umbilicata TaxID=1912855 RepID=UPI002A7DAE72|nr:adenylate cyclase [Faecalimonas umbilicata]MDY2660221.1 adenylate cyclase [Mediterraneibacter gnavus]MDY5094065.1 adenylate cyclase [Faecalimonas umbilicata]MDY5251985.1 adenylate cyclase [Erysipelotrichaceae bacterium]